jgi:tRNA (guanine37-N1)-methyltransferase
MRIDVITIFPAYVEPLRLSLVGKAVDAGTVDLLVHDLRDFTHDRHRTVDDTPYGGGPGMVMSPVPWGEALDSVAASDPGRHPVLVIPTPSGATFTQATAQEWSGADWLVFACGRYEGIDSRVAEHYAGRADWADVREVSIGDYVLAGGEAAVLVMVEATVRLLPGVLGNAESVVDDSFAPGSMADLLEGPIYTKPPAWRDLAVPEILLSGHHGRIAEWRRQQAQQRTRDTRPDLRRP